MQTIQIKPADDLQVRLEDGSGYLAAEGQTVALTGYWHRRLADGDVIEVPDAPAKPARKSAEG